MFGEVQFLLQTEMTHVSEKSEVVVISHISVVSSTTGQCNSLSIHLYFAFSGF